MNIKKMTREQIAVTKLLREEETKKKKEEQRRINTSKILQQFLKS